MPKDPTKSCKYSCPFSQASVSVFSGVSTDNVHLKILVPSIAAGAIIGKGGETITQIQKETGANIKMSKANDFYPGKTISFFFC